MMERKVEKKKCSGSALETILAEGSRDMLSHLVLEEVKNKVKLNTSQKGKLSATSLLRVTIGKSAYIKLLKGLVNEEVDIYYDCISDTDKVIDIKNLLRGDEHIIQFIANDVLKDLETLCEKEDK